MKYSFKPKILTAAILLLFSLTGIYSREKLTRSCLNDNTYNNPREHLLMDSGWRFAFGHAADTRKDFNYGTRYFTYMAKAGYGDGPAFPGYEDRTWRVVDLPHDWAVELPFDSSASHSHGYKTIGYKFPGTSVGWYRKTFSIPASDLGKEISIQFDGIFRNSIIWINGFYVGHEISGYASSIYDVTDYLNYGGNNVVTVRVDASIEEGWFYEGAGIYRHVWLNKTSKLHVAQYGTFVTSELNGNNAVITIRTTIDNETPDLNEFSLEQYIIDSEGSITGRDTLIGLSLKQGASNVFYSKIKINNPKLWSTENPYIHRLVTTLLQNGKVVDIYETPFGIRTVKFDPDKGFFLNGQNVKIKGTNEHQDFAGVGTALPDALHEFRINKLKEMGVNAIRTSHNPPASEFLDACDRLGVLVLDENRLMGSNEEHLTLLKRLMLRDRNHPSVILWSLGNEEWAIEGNDKGARIASTMQNFAQHYDSSRAFTAACSGGWDDGIGKVVQVMGYNYIVQGNIDEHHKRFPWQSGIGTEENNIIGTRGIYETNTQAGHMAPTNRMPENVGTETGWKFYDARPFLSGLFFWTGFDYRGEPNPLAWPAVCSEYGIVDLCGFPKDAFYYLKSWWTNYPVLHVFPHWNSKIDGQEVNVKVYSNCDEVELLLNNKSLGRKSLNKNEHLEWQVAYHPGTLSARGYINGKEVITDKIETTGKPANIQLKVDKNILKSDGEDISVITVSVNDDRGMIVPDASDEIVFSINGPGKLIGVGNGDPASHEPDKFIESVDRVAIEDLKLQTTDTSLNRPEVVYEYDDSNWSKAFKSSYGEYEQGKNIIIRGVFNLSDFSDKTEISLYSKSLAEGQNIYINGVLIGSNIKRDDPNQVFIIKHEILHKGKNVIVYAGKPFVKSYMWEEINSDPGVIKVVNPPAPWKRKVFNGLAEVIVQTKKQAGEIILSAESKGLLTGKIKLNSQPAVLRKSIDN
jgi:beta-galactosidase